MKIVQRNKKSLEITCSGVLSTFIMTVQEKSEEAEYPKYRAKKTGYNRNNSISDFFQIFSNMYLEKNEWSTKFHNEKSREKFKF